MQRRIFLSQWGGIILILFFFTACGIRHVGKRSGWLTSGLYTAFCLASNLNWEKAEVVRLKRISKDLNLSFADRGYIFLFNKSASGAAGQGSLVCGSELWDEQQKRTTAGTISIGSGKLYPYQPEGAPWPRYGPGITPTEYLADALTTFGSMLSIDIEGDSMTGQAPMQTNLYVPHTLCIGTRFSHAYHPNLPTITLNWEVDDQAPLDKLLLFVEARHHTPESIWRYKKHIWIPDNGQAMVPISLLTPIPANVRYTIGLIRFAVKKVDYEGGNIGIVTASRIHKMYIK